MGKARRVIFVTDGDETARRAVEVAAQNIGGRCISASAIDSPDLRSDELVKLIKSAHHDPVVVMFDDKGSNTLGAGEKLLADVARDGEIEVLGVVAVASDTPKVRGITVDESITKDGEVTQGAVDKAGIVSSDGRLRGDTVDVLEELDVPMIVGIGDPGKMDFADDADTGAPITTMALQEILRRSGDL